MTGLVPNLIEFVLNQHLMAARSAQIQQRLADSKRTQASTSQQRRQVPVHRKKTMVANLEAFTKQVAEETFGCAFTKVRPAWQE